MNFLKQLSDLPGVWPVRRRCLVGRRAAMAMLPPLEAGRAATDQDSGHFAVEPWQRSILENFTQWLAVILLGRESAIMSPACPAYIYRILLLT